MKATKEKRETVKSLPRKLRGQISRRAWIEPKEVDFAYAVNLPAHLQRMAAFWEYARESAPLRELVEKEYDSWRETWGDETVVQRWQNELAERFGTDRLLLVTNYPFFPFAPFEQIIKCGAFSRFYTARGFGSASVYCFPLARAEQFRPRFEREGYALYGVAIPWKRTDRELAKMFEQELRTLRPERVPEPAAHPGRRGRSPTESPLDLLNQLAVLRLQRQGVRFQIGLTGVGTKGNSYASRRAWTNAVRAAQERIDNMLKKPFFKDGRK